MRRVAALLVGLRAVIPVAWVALAVLATVTLPALGTAGSAPLDDLVAQEGDAATAQQQATEQFGFPLYTDTVVVAQIRVGSRRGRRNVTFARPMPSDSVGRRTSRTCARRFPSAMTPAPPRRRPRSRICSSPTRRISRSAAPSRTATRSATSAVATAPSWASRARRRHGSRSTRRSRARFRSSRPAASR